MNNVMSIVIIPTTPDYYKKDDYAANKVNDDSSYEQDNY
jgi:hypothetical protein